MRNVALLSRGSARLAPDMHPKVAEKLNTELYLEGWVDSDMCLILTFNLTFLPVLHSSCFTLSGKAQGLDFSKS